MDNVLEKIKYMLCDMEVDYCIISEQDDICYYSKNFKKNESLFEHTKTKISSASDTVTLEIIKKNDTVTDLSKLIKAYIENDIPYKKKKHTFDDLFCELIDNEVEIDEQILKEFKIKTSSKWIIVCVEYYKQIEEDIRDILKRSLPKRVQIAAYEKKANTTMLLVEIPLEIKYEEIIQYIKGLYQMLESEFSEKINIGTSSAVDNLREAKKLLDQAKKAAIFGKMQTGKDGIYIYDELGIAKMISNLSSETSKKFREELLSNSGIDLLDVELLKTIKVYFQNDLNTSETARNLYIHRNTLSYRLEKIKKLTRIDLNKFDDSAYLRMLLLFRESAERREEL